MVSCNRNCRMYCTCKNILHCIVVYWWIALAPHLEMNISLYVKKKKKKRYHTALNSLVKMLNIFFSFHKSFKSYNISTVYKRIVLIQFVKSYIVLNLLMLYLHLPLILYSMLYHTQLCTYNTVYSDTVYQHNYFCQSSGVKAAQCIFLCILYN